LHRLIGEDVELLLETEPELGTVKADVGQIEQVIMNLALNARDAMPGGGQLTISTANIELDLGDPRHQSDSSAGSYVALAVKDTGCGMDAVTQARIFEPFFTNKDLSKGTGLGLATVYGIVKQSRGTISVRSEPGYGSTFTICLPRVEGKPQLHSVEKPSAEVLSGIETILLVEDAEPLREVARQFLQHGGYKVLVAEDSMGALAVSRKHGGPIDLLLTDVVMPGLSGPQLAQKMCLTHPGMQVLFMSGYTDEALGQHGVLEEGIALLEKPFTRGSLLRKLREILDPVKSSSQVEAR
jgi:CheY-like chemotaxis protein